MQLSQLVTAGRAPALPLHLEVADEALQMQQLLRVNMVKQSSLMVGLSIQEIS